MPQGHFHIFWIKIVRKMYNNQYVNVYLLDKSIAQKSQKCKTEI